MKKTLQTSKTFRSLRNFLSLCLVMVMSVGMSWGETTVTVNASQITSSSATWTANNVSWSINVTGGATGQSVTNGYAQVGTKNSPSTSITFSTSGISGTITSIVIDCASYQGKATVNATVGGSSFGTQSQSTPSWSSTSGGEVSFFGSASGNIVITMANGSGGRAMYVKSIAVTYTSGGDTPTPTTYTVTYDANGGSGTMTDNNSPYNAGSTVTVLDNEFSRSNYTFSNWNTAADGSGTDYEEGDNFTITANTTLYAQWTENTTPGPTPSGDAVTYDFTQINDFSSWLTSYSQHIVTYSDARVTFASANRQTSTITNQPVTKGNEVSLVLTDGSTMSSATFVCTQWGTKVQTITLHYSTDGGQTYTSTGTTSTNFTISNDNLPAGTNAVKITFSSTNQVGIASATIVKVISTEPSIAASNVNIGYDATSGEIEYSITNPTTGTSLTANTTASWLTVGIVGDDNVPFTCSANTTTSARTATVTLIYGTVTKDVTVTQAAAPASYAVTYTLANSIVSGKTYIIVGQYENVYYAMGEQKSNNRAGVAITVDGTTASVASDDVYEFTISSLATSGFYSIYDARTPGYLYAASSSSNNLKTETTLDANGNGDWKITFNDGVATIVAENSENRNVMQFNGSSADNKLFSCYGSASQHPVYLYVKDEAPVEYTLTVSNLEHVNTYVFAGDESEMLFEGAGSGQIYDGTEVMVSVDVDEGYTLQNLMVDGVNHASDIDGGMYIFTMPAHDVTITATAVETPSPVTITFDAGNGTCETENMSGLVGSSITLPTATPSAECSTAGWEFVGWSTSSVEETQTAPTLLTGNYTITGEPTLHAVYSMTETSAGNSTASVTFSESGYANQETITSATIGDVTATFDKGNNTNAPKYYTTGEAIRCYGGNTITLTHDNTTISAITLTFASGGNSNEISSDVGTYDNNNGSWTGNSSSVVLTIGGTTGHRRISKISVTYGAGSVTTYATSPSCLDRVATPTFSPEGGDYFGSQSVEISCETAGATIHYTTDGSTPTSESTEYTAAITVDETTTIKAIAVKNGMSNSLVATATYNIEQPLTTMQQIFDAATVVGNTATTKHITFDNWVITGANNSQHAYLSDGTKGCVIFGDGHGFSEGDILSGTVECKVQLYNGAAEITQLTSNTQGLTVTPNGNVSVANIALADLAGVNTGALVHYDNLTCSVNNNKYYLTDGTTTIQVYSTLYAFEPLIDGKTYNITGVYQQFNSTKEVLPRRIEDIEIVGPYISVSPELISFNAVENNGTLDIQYDNFTVSGMEDFSIQFCDANGNALASTDYPDWIEVLVAEDQGNYVVSCVITDNNIQADQTAYFKVQATDNENNTVYSNLVTVEFEIPGIWMLVTDINSLNVGDKVVIANKDYKRAMSTEQKNDNRGETNVEINDNILTVTNDVQQFTIGKVGDYFTFHTAINGNSHGYIYAASSEKNYLRTKQTLDANGQWAISIDNEGVASVIAHGSNTRKYLQYNHSSNLFSCYGSASQDDVSLYKKSTTPHTVTFDAGTGHCDITEMNVSGFFFPEASTNCTGYAFVGWSTSPVEATQQVPALLYTAGSRFALAHDMTFYAVYATGTSPDSWEFANTIATGDVVYLVHEDATSGIHLELSGISNDETPFGTLYDYNDIGHPSGKQPLTVVAGNTEGTYAFQMNNGHYLKGGENQLSEFTSITAASSWRVSIDAETHHATITNVSNENWKLQKDNEDAKLACYTSTLDPVVLYNHTITGEYNSNPCSGCLIPSNLNVVEGSVSDNSVQLEWTAGYEVTAWQICLNNDETNLIMANSNNPFTIENLTASTTYTAKVRAYCDEDSQSEWSESVSFRTECATITSLPWTENFTNGIPTECWENTGWTNSDGAAYASIENNTLELITPKISIPASSNAQLTFKSKVAYIDEYGTTQQNSVLIYEGNSTTPSSTINIPAPTIQGVWEDIAPIDLSSFAEGTIRIAFRYWNNGANQDWYIDDVTVEMVLPKYTVYFNDGNGICLKDTMFRAGAIELPDATAVCEDDYILAGWSLTPVNAATSEEELELFTSYTPTQNTVLYAVYTDLENYSSFPACDIMPIPYSNDFESEAPDYVVGSYGNGRTYVKPAGWTIVSQDPLTTRRARPQVFYTTSYAHSGNFSLRLDSAAVLAMPRLADDVDVSQLTMELYVRQPNADQYLEIGVMTDLSNPNSFESVATINNETSSVDHWTVNFSEYENDPELPHYIAFRNVGTDSRSINNIDDISIYFADENLCEIQISDLPYSENFDDISESTVDRTGDEPECWTLAHQYAKLTNSTKPQVFRTRSYAHSGYYSLRMEGQCIYTMPKFADDIDISSLQMELYVRQPYAHDQLEVGVMTDINDPETFTAMGVINNGSNGVEQKLVKFSNAPQGAHYIAFRNLRADNAAGKSINNIDDIVISVIPESNPCEILISDLPYSENFDGISQSTNDRTGDQPECWTVAHQYANLSNTTKPQVFYTRPYAHSDYYSLRMEGQCIYVMPKFADDINISGLSMELYVRQPYSYDQLEVGVMTDINDPATFTAIGEPINTTPKKVEQFVIDFAGAPAGAHYIAFRNSKVDGGSGKSINNIDDISIFETGTRAVAQYNGNGYDVDDYNFDYDADLALEPTGVDGFDISDFTVYPNPTTGLLTLGMEAQRVEVTSLTGQKVALFENTSSIDISSLPSGVYILKATLPQGTAVRKVVKR